MRVLVTGGTGYLGQAIVRALAARGHTPVVFARSASAAPRTDQAVAIDGDVRDRAAVDAAARGCQAVCHSAALVSQWRRDPSDFDAVNVDGLAHVVAACRAHDIARLVYTSSFLALPPAGATAPVALNDYQRTKVAAAALARREQAAGAPIVLLYPGVVYGPGARTEANLVGRLLDDHARGRLPGVIGPEHIWSFAWIDDVAAAHVAALEHPAPAPEYQLGGENAPVIRAFEHGRDAGLFGGLPRRLPYPLASAVAWFEEQRARLTGRAPLVTRGSVDIFRHDWPVASDAAARDFGLQVTPLATGIGRLAEAVRPQAQGPGPRANGQDPAARPGQPST